jgi:hypothetical protein
MRAELLHVVTCIANPVRWESRIRLFREHFLPCMHAAGVRLTVVECQYGERPFELTEDAKARGFNLVGVRAKTLVWNKENLLNLGIANIATHFDPGFKYVAWVDADIKFRKSNWASETVHALQQYDWVQPWSDAYDLGPDDSHISHHKSFGRLFWEDKPVASCGPKHWKFDGGPYDYAHTGYAWAATRQSLEWVGGLIDFAAMGAGDHHMALSLVGRADRSMPGRVHPAYARRIYDWQRKALEHINQNFGFVWGTVEHPFHGGKANRKYVERWDMIVEEQFNPDVDIKRNVFGVMELTGNKPRLRHLLDVYFKSRNEDANTF